MARPVRPIDTRMSFEPGGALLGRELVGDGPAGRLGGEAQQLAPGQVVDLDDHAVDLVVEVVAVLLPVEAVSRAPRRGSDSRRISGLTGKPSDPSQSSVSWWLVNAGPALDLAELVRPQGQLAVGGDAGILLAQGAGRRVAGVDERAQLGRDLALVERPEGGQRHVDLAPHLEHRGGALAQALGDLGDRADVLGDVLARAAVAPGGGPHVAAALVADRDGEAVDLELAHVADLVGPPRRRTPPGPRPAAGAGARPTPAARPRRTRCRGSSSAPRASTGANTVGRGAPPTCWVGESGVMSSGNSSSSARSSRTSSSNSASLMVGSSSSW